MDIIQENFSSFELKIVYGVELSVEIKLLLIYHQIRG